MEKESKRNRSGGSALPCRCCGSTNVTVTRSRVNTQYKMRSFLCRDCEKRWNTHEVYEVESPHGVRSLLHAARASQQPEVIDLRDKRTVAVVTQLRTALDGRLRPDPGGRFLYGRRGVNHG